MNAAITELEKVRQNLVAAKEQAISKFDFEISEVDRPIRILQGKDPKDSTNTSYYDDEHPDYIKGSIED
jgi:hypothetical protein